MSKSNCSRSTKLKMRNEKEFTQLYLVNSGLSKAHSSDFAEALYFVSALVLYSAAYDCFGHLSLEVQLPQKLQHHQALPLRPSGFGQRPTHHLRDTIHE